MNEVDLHSSQYQAIVGDLAKIVNEARDSAARSVDAAMTAAYWLIGHRIVGLEQSRGCMGGIRHCVNRKTGDRIDTAIWTRLLASETPEYALVLPLVPT